MDLVTFTVLVGASVLGTVAGLYVFVWLAAGGTTASMLAKVVNRVRDRMGE